MRKTLKNAVHKIAAIILSSLVCFSFFLPKWGAGVTKAFADSESLAFDSTPVKDDIQGIDYLLYPAIKGVAPQLYLFQEYSYADSPLKIENYALYIYIYNPNQTEYATLTGASCVNMAATYQKNDDGSYATTSNGDLIPASYRNFSLKYCGATEESGRENLFVKFRIMGLADVLANVQQMEAEGRERQYDLVGFQLFEKGAQNAVDYKITNGGDIDEGGRTYYFSGYAEGYGAGAESKATLSSRFEDLGVVNLEVQHTSYKTGVSSLGKGHQNELQTVYFAVDNRFLEEYGRLQKIAAQWYEYKMTPALVTNAEIYEKLLPFVGLDISTLLDSGEGGDGHGGGGGSWASLDDGVAVASESTASEITTTDDIPYSIYHLRDTYTSGLGTYIEYKYSYTWNKELLDSGVIYELSDYDEKILKLLFKTPTSFNVNDYTVSGEEVLAAAKSYTAGTATLPIKDGTVPADCFLSTVDEGRTFGYNFREFDADSVDDEWDLLSYDDTHSKWDRFWEFFGEWGLETNDSYKDVKPIYKVTDADMTQTDDEQLASSLLIDETDVEDFRKYYKAQTAVSDEHPNGQTVFLFRFAATDYYAVPLTVVETDTGDTVSDDDNIQAEVRQGTAFLDFEIISLTFNDNGELTLIGAVSSPIDAIGDYTPALVDDGCAEIDFKRFFAIVFIVAVAITVIRIISSARSKYIAEATYRNTKKKK